MSDRPRPECFIDSAEAFSKMMVRAQEEEWQDLGLVPDVLGWRRWHSRNVDRRTLFILRGQWARAVGLVTVNSLRHLLVCVAHPADNWVRAIAQYFPNLTALYLEGAIADDDVCAVAPLSSLTRVHLHGDVGNEGARAIAQLPALTTLNLRGNRIGDAGARAIAQLPALKSLDLSSNSIGDEGARAIAQLPALMSLDLSSNRIGDDGVRAIARLSTLKSLDLRDNLIGDEGARAFEARALASWHGRGRLPPPASLDTPQLSALKLLNLKGNSIGDDGAHAVARLSTLASLDLSSNRIGDDGARAVARLSALTALDLRNNYIGDEGARAIARLPALTSLDLRNNNIGVDGACAIARASGLRSLYLGNNRARVAGARAIAQLSALEFLDLSANSIGSDGARAIARLSALKFLDLRDNRIGNEGARALAQLSALKLLYLAENGIGNEGARALAQLSALKLLYLEGNSIGNEGARALTQLAEVVTLDLTRNSATIVPREVLEGRDAQAIFAAIQRFDSSPHVRPLNEAKLLVLGREAVGKTSLVRYLVRDEPRDPDEKRTPGVKIHERIETHPWFPSGHGPRLNVWDFGGQEIYHETHKFFLTQRSIYLLVLEARREDDTSVYHWLRTIANRAGDSPIVIVINKCDDGTSRLHLNETSLVREWPTIAGFVRTSCNASDYARESIGRLRSKICALLAEDARLQRVRDPFPIAWHRVKDALTALADRENVLDQVEFTRLCELPDDADTAITNPDEQRALLRVLHELGVIVAQGLNNNAPAALQRFKLLDPNWLTTAIYNILTAAQVVQQGGVFRRSQLAELLDPADYPPSRWEFVLSLMQLDGVGLCFLLRGVDEEYLVPEALPKNEPHCKNWPRDSLRFRYTYEFLPRALIPRFIVEAHPRITDTRWREGAVLEVAGCYVLVRGNLKDDLIDILVDGPIRQRRAALEVVRADLEVVHELNPESKPTARVPLPDDPKVTVEYEHLLTLERREGPEHTFIPQGSQSRYKVSDLLDGVRGNEPRARSRARTATSRAEAKFRELKRDYTGVWGLKVFALAIVTLAPIYINFKSLDLRFSPATLVFVVYHAVSMYCWVNVGQLVRQPGLFVGEEREERIDHLSKIAKVAGVCGWAVWAVIIATAFTIGSLTWGDAELQARMPEPVCNFLGVPKKPRS